jgi:hypothetical protein
MYTGMARHQVADGADGMQIWRVAVNILNKQSRTAERGWSSSLWLGTGADSPPPSNLLSVTKQEGGPRNRTGSLARTKHRKMVMSFGTWNGGSLYSIGSLKTVGRELEKCKLDLVGVQEVKWEKGGIELYSFLWRRE